MKKLFLSIIAITAFLASYSQTDSLQQYTGKFIFPEGNPVSEITLSVQDGQLIASSAIGNTEFRNTGADIFEIVAYAGVATFKRNEDGKIIKLHILVGTDVNMEGVKQEEKLN